MKFSINIFFTGIFGALLLVGCAPRKKIMVEAAKYEDAGMYQEAYAQYDEIYHRFHNVDAHIGLKRSAQKILDASLNEALMKYNRGDYKGAIKQYDEAFQFQEGHKELQLIVSPLHETTYHNAQRNLIQSLYDSAEEYVLVQDYGKALAKLDELFRYAPDHKEAEYLEVLARIYPEYNKGVKAMELGLFREAYGYFLMASEIDADFKDVLSLRDECKEKATITIAYIPVSNDVTDDKMPALIAGQIQDHILDLRDPFIKLLDRENLNQLIKEQQNAMGASFDQKDAIEAGKFLGAEYVITGEIISYKVSQSPMNSMEKKGYLGPKVSSKKVRYYEYNRIQRLEANYRFRLLNTETGEVYAAENIPYIYNDMLHFADFEGDNEKLYAGEWKFPVFVGQRDVVYNSKEEKRALETLLSARRSNVSIVQMEHDFVGYVGTKVMAAVGDYSSSLE